MPNTIRKSKPRLTIEIDEHEHQIIKQYMEHGFQKKLFGAIVTDVVAMLEEFGNEFVLAMLARQINMRLYLDAARKHHEEKIQKIKSANSSEFAMAK